ncbi:hypothetical protein [Streptomyces uncialis]|uniref:hypothetical protein n=1 Tax=Streptomyces uncialis TaxID=1048205 RepID=UPI00386981B5|nr:hypothetical protein OG924_12525 [Streptomyces uncialis]
MNTPQTAPSCTGCDSTAHGYLCHRHQEQLATHLTELPALYAEVGDCLVPRRSGWGDIIATRGAAGPRSPVNEDVIDTVNYGRAAEVIRLWRTDVRRLRWPHRDAPPPGDLGADCHWLTRQLDWISVAYPAAPDLAREVRELNLAARSVTGDPPPRRQHIGVCVAVTDDAGTVCGAALTRLPGEPLSCRRCGTAYRTEADLLLLHHHQPRTTTDRT